MFMHQNGFVSISERDSAGWTPLCYAPGLDDCLDLLRLGFRFEVHSEARIGAV